MSCVLRIYGKHFDVDDFILQSNLRTYEKFYKGDTLKGRPNGKKREYSGLKADVSNAEFTNFEKQIKDAFRYLKRHKEKLKHISSTKDIQYAVLDFGVDNTKKFTQSTVIPNNFLKLTAELGLSIEISLYNPNY